MGALDGHKAIVTGGGAGIGEAICRRFAGEGAQVAVLDRDLASAQAVAEAIEGIALECDVANAAAVEDAVSRVHDEFGTVTDLVNNAGMGMNKPLHRYRDEEWALVMAVNLTGTFHCMRAVIPRMLDAGGGGIVNNASLNGVRPLSGEAPYSAAKAAVINLTMTAAVEYAPTIRVNCVSPGLIATPVDLARHVEPLMARRRRVRHAASASRHRRRGRDRVRVPLLRRGVIHHRSELRDRRRRQPPERASRSADQDDHEQPLISLSHPIPRILEWAKNGAAPAARSSHWRSSTS